MDDLDNLPRKELQALAKANGIKANLATMKIIAELRNLQADKPLADDTPYPASPAAPQQEVVAAAS
eukprot:CAMPEP_0173412900 /NCGR_PEP_ID=MMETSP1356-20130122/80619_1 /TAXON_ID=77927 ORGANISM="Hemiselmis virescens, Strain PCC157" /NCGR_SAMPLE_ID=MMETSP1356 /ASSEMBLY_ACC=CAM_ASM_000847 /LENGTH=65 /DNA_ID=CAMNT_0014374853 /DNA_START=24 /DNA_END=217 /DNA_ORIENTATION=+